MSNKFLSNKELKGIFKYFIYLDKKTIFKVISLLDIEDIKLILKKFGPQLDVTKNNLSASEEERIFFLINNIIPKIYTQYLLFKTGLSQFFKMSVNEVKCIIYTLPETLRNLIYTQFNPIDLKFNENVKIKDDQFREIFRELQSKRYLRYFAGLSEEDVQNIRTILTERQVLTIDKLKDNADVKLGKVESNFINEELATIIDLYKKLKKGLLSLIKDTPLNLIKRKIGSLNIDQIHFIYSIYDIEDLSYKLDRNLSPEEFRKLWKIFIVKNSVRKSFITIAKKDLLNQDFEFALDSMDELIKLPSFYNLMKKFGTKTAVIIGLNLLALDGEEGFGELIRTSNVYIGEDALTKLEEYKNSIDEFLTEYSKYINKKFEDVNLLGGL